MVRAICEAHLNDRRTVKVFMLMLGLNGTLESMWQAACVGM